MNSLVGGEMTVILVHQGYLILFSYILIWVQVCCDMHLTKHKQHRLHLSWPSSLKDTQMKALH